MTDDTVLKMGAIGAKVTALQESLAKLDYSLGDKDGDFANLTRDAVLAFQADNGLSTTGEMDDGTWKALSTASPRPLARARTTITAADLAKKGSSTILQANRTKNLGWLSGILGVLGLGSGAYQSSPGGSAPAEAAAANPATSAQPAIDGLTNLLDTLTSALTPAQLKGARANLDTIQETLASGGEGLAAASNVGMQLFNMANAILPGAGESVVFLLVGLAAHFFGGQVVQSRVKDHRDAANLGK